MARRLFRKKRPQQSRSLAAFLIAVLCLGVGYALWFTDSTRQRETAEVSIPVATDAGQPVRLPSGFGNAFIDRPSMRLGNPIDNDRRSESNAAAKPVIDPGAAELTPPPALPAGDGPSGPSQALKEALPGAGAGAPRWEPAAESAGPTSAPAADPPAPSRGDASAGNGEQIRSAGSPPATTPENPTAALAVEPAAGPAAPPAATAEPPTLASLNQPQDRPVASDAASTHDIRELVPRPVPRARQSFPNLNDEEPIDARTQDPPPSARDDTLAIVAAPLRPVIVPPPLEDDEPLVAEQQPGAQSLDAEDDLPPATSRNVARSLVAAGVRNREPVNTVGATVNLREIDRGQLHYFSELTGLMGRKVEHRWIYRGRVEGTMRFQVGSNRWRASSRKTILPHQKGEWRVVVVDEAGRELGGSRFLVE